MQVTAKLTNGGDKKNITRELAVEFEMPDTLQGMVARFGEDVVYNNAVDNIVIGLQAFMRSQMSKTGDKRLDDAAIRKAVAEWKPGVRRAADPAKKVEGIKKAFANLTPEMRRAMLAELRNVK